MTTQRFTGGTVYGLYDPRDGALRYVGKTIVTVRARLKGHLCDAKRHPHTHVARWISVLARLKLKPIARVFGFCQPPQMASVLEQQVIGIAKAAGANLTNLTDGGEGTIGWKPRPETIERFRQRTNVWMGRKHSEESRRLMSASCKRVWESPELRAMQSKRHKGKTITKAMREAVGGASRRNWADPAYRARVLETRRTSAAVRDSHLKLQKPVVDSLGREYPSIRAAADAIGVSVSAIGHTLHGKIRRVKGLTFHFKDAAS